MRNKHKAILKAVFKTPTSGSINWSDIESLFIALGADVTEGRGSRVRIELNGVFAVFHRPHPEKEACKGAVQSVRKLIQEAGVKL